jgi:predicted RNA-binding Zn ribbon-like protein
MHLSDKFPVPAEIALLYDFVNSLDLRHYVEQGETHVPGDELATTAQLESWMRARGLLARGARLGAEDHRSALELREALRTFLELPPAGRAGKTVAAVRLNAAAANFPLTLRVLEVGGVTMQPPSTSSSGGLGKVLAELYCLSVIGSLDRLKSCDSDECRWIFYDRSKPGNRRWCSSALCGNRQKTRAHRRRRREAGAAMDASNRRGDTQ